MITEYAGAVTVMENRYLDLYRGSVNSQSHVLIIHIGQDIRTHLNM